MENNLFTNVDASFGITSNTLKRVIINQIKATKRKKMKKLSLFNTTMKLIGVRKKANTKDELYALFVDILGEMRDEGTLTFKTGKDATYIEVKSVK